MLTDLMGTLKREIWGVFPPEDPMFDFGSGKNSVV